MAESVAVPTFGTTLSRNGSPIAQIQDVTGPQLSTDTDEITNHSSPDGVEEFAVTVKRTGEVTFPIVFNPGDSTHADLVDAWSTRSKDAYELRTPDGGYGWDFDAYVTGVSQTYPVGGHLGCDVTLRPAGAPQQHTAGS